MAAGKEAFKERTKDFKDVRKNTRSMRRQMRKGATSPPPAARRDKPLWHDPAAAVETVAA